MTIKLNKRNGDFGPSRACNWLDWLLMLLFLITTLSAQTPPPGLRITNQARATYLDNESGFHMTVSSNFVNIIVNPLPGLVLEEEQRIYRPVGGKVTLPHRLMNTGNTRSAYRLNVTNHSPDDYDVENLSIYQDINANGVDDPGERRLTDSDSLWLEAGEAAYLVVTGTVPSGLTANKTSKVLLGVSVRSAGGTLQSAANIDQVITTGGALIKLYKAASKLDPQPGSSVVFTLTGTNSGTEKAFPASVTVDDAARDLVLVCDSIPPNTVFAGLENTLNALPLYHLIGASPRAYTTAVPGDLAMVDEVAFGYAGVPIGGSFSASFRVDINENASGKIDNIAAVVFNDGFQADDIQIHSNRVRLQLPDTPPVIRYFDKGYKSVVNSVTLRDTLYLEANAAQCNQNMGRIDTIHITISSVLTGDVEQFLGVETGVNSGRFRIVPFIPTRDAENSFVVRFNGTMETQKNDELKAELFGCGTGETITRVMIEPYGVIYDSRTNRLVEGASVTLIDVTGDGNGGRPGEAARVLDSDGKTLLSATVITGPDGRFDYPMILPSTYRITITPPAEYRFPSILAPALLPPGHVTLEPGSYGGNFVINDQNESVNLDIPLDSKATNGLFIRKEAAEKAADIADMLDYTIHISNTSGGLLGGVSVRDTLPDGFLYLAGTSRLDGQRIADPAGGGSSALEWEIGSLAKDATVRLGYRVRLQPGASLGNAVNVAQAFSAPPLPQVSNIAANKVEVRSGILGDEGFLVGKVFLDCNGNGIQDNDEVGVPGVRLYLENGTFTITDPYGRYTFYGIAPQTHVLKLDYATLPPGAALADVANRQMGDPGSYFVDLKKGELHKTDFALCNCEPEIVEAIIERYRESSGRRREIDRSLTMPMNPDGSRRLISDVKRLAASGIVGNDMPAINDAALPLKPRVKIDERNSNLPSRPLHKMVSIPLKRFLAEADNQLAFLNVHHDDTLAYRQASIQVKGKSDAAFLLFVNKQQVADRRIGERAVIVKRLLEAREYVGVPLLPGKNVLSLVQFDGFGNPRAAREITVYAPDKPAYIRLSLAAAETPADGHSIARIGVHLQDDDGIAVTSRTPLTVEVSRGHLEIKDLNTLEPGIQTFIQDGFMELPVLAPREAGTCRLRVASGRMEAEIEFDFIPDLRPLIAAGLIEGSIHLRNLNPASLLPTHQQDSFEREIQELSWQSNDRQTNVRGRAALYLKGKIRGNVLLTMAYDSDKQLGERLFRDIQPDEYYPVYGESSLKGFDAQSTGRLYIRLDKRRSYVLLGDYITQNYPEGRQLSLYNRSMSGVKGVLNHHGLRMDVFAARDNTRQIIDELPGQGISGPYLLSRNDLVENSEKIEIITRDRNQPAVVLRREALVRFRDYVLEPLTGRILFRTPVPSVDANLNPISIRVIYESEAGGDNYWTAGVDGQFRVTRYLNLGATLVEDQEPGDSLRLIGANAALQFGKKTVLYGEYARTERSSSGKGAGQRMELRHQGERLQGRMYAGSADRNFENPSATFIKGRQEAGIKGALQVGEKLRINGEALHTKDVSSGGTRNGGHLYLERNFAYNSSIELGVRHSRESAQPAQVNSGSAGEINTSLRAKLRTQAPKIKRLSLFGEYEQEINEREKRIIAGGGTYQIADRGRLYARHEFVSSLNGRYALNSNQEQHSTVVGLDADYIKSGRLFSEYRIRDAINGRESQAAVGLRNRWRLSSRVALNTTLERIFTINGKKENESSAATAAVEYLPNDFWKATTRMEVRDTPTHRSYLNTIGLAYRLTQGWTFLGRNVLSRVDGKNNNDALVRGWLRIGTAYRDVLHNRWNLLNRYELKYDKDVSAIRDTRKLLHLFSTHVNHHPRPSLTLSGRYAGKWGEVYLDNIRSIISANLVSGRVIRELGKRFDVSMVGSLLFTEGVQTRHHGLGGELGFRVITNLWLSGGYNFFGYQDADLANQDYTEQGAFLRVRFKFDEDLFKRFLSGKQKYHKPAYKICGYLAAVPAPIIPVPEIEMADMPIDLQITPAARQQPVKLPDRVHFALNRWELSKRSETVLDEMAAFLMENPKVRIILEGHTDTRADNEYNRLLGLKRAVTVKFYLVSKGIDAVRIIPRTRGENIPLGKEVSARELARNRRVIFILEPADQTKLVRHEYDLQLERYERHAD